MSDPNYRADFVDGEKIKAVDMNTNFESIEEGKPFVPEAIDGALLKHDTVSLQKLTDEVRQIIAVHGGSAVGNKTVVVDAHFDKTITLDDLPVPGTEFVQLNGVHLVVGIDNDYIMVDSLITFNASMEFEVDDVILVKYDYMQ